MSLIIKYKFRLFLKRDLPEKIILEPLGEIKSLQQLEDYISILNLIKKYCD